jgi:hypothetical protein
MTDNRQFAPKGYVDTQVATKVSTGASLSVLGAPTANFGFGGFRLNNVADPVSAQDVATLQWVLNQFPQYPPSYTIRLNIGDVPSFFESVTSTGDKNNAQICSVASYDSGTAGGIAFFTVFLDGLPFGTGNYEVMTQIRSNRGTTTGVNLDNDMTYLTVFAKTTTSFRLMVEETFNVVQNVSFICLLVPSP